MAEGRRIVIADVKPEIDCGVFPIKRVAGEKVVVTADIYADGHDSVSARLLYKGPKHTVWNEIRMCFIENDRWSGEFPVEDIGVYYYTIQGWVDHFRTWQMDLRKKADSGQNITGDVLVGVALIENIMGMASDMDRQKLLGYAELLRSGTDTETIVSSALDQGLGDLVARYLDAEFISVYGKELRVVVDRPRALFSSWYEMFPRSCSQDEKHGTFRDCEAMLPDIAQMGFDVLYFPPLHPIGESMRKGKNNTLVVGSDEVGSPWAIGSGKGGHKAVHPDLGTVEDFQRFITKAKEYGLEVAMDLALQCSPDHPYVKEHPEWFRWRPDGTVQYAENPPKKYEDIIPFNFETEQGDALWNELKSIVLFWIEKGIRIFRVDNPHTKPFVFWQWLLQELKAEYPDLIFLSEAFTRPKVMYHLAKLGFTQSYTYFTWRNTKSEIMRYIHELTTTDVREYFRPNFWPNTPDILPEHLQFGGRNAFMMRLVLAATLSSSYGIYGPAFELVGNEALPGKEEYLDSEKYELKRWDRDSEGNLKDFIARVNRIRRENPALQTTNNIQYYEVDNDNLLSYGKIGDDPENIILVVVNLDPFHTHSGWVNIPIQDLGINASQPYLVHDLLGDEKYIWQGGRNYVEIDPYISPAHIFRIRKKLRKEIDFDYFL
ncbi:MAG: alpha-1,4-glucan--maltose-1-phosphate maltosyltransferase [Nitrospirales bacterium]|nr:MAG: alpha-1,4-glucan--maltose-1-phosphate maltosyltransferase [Nitrospirales bacterium]